MNNKNGKIKLVLVSLFAAGLTLLVVYVLKNGSFFRLSEVAQGGGSGGDEISDGQTIADFVVDGSTTSSPYTVTVPVAASGWRTASFQFENMANATVTLWGSNDSRVSSTDFYGQNGVKASSTRTFLNITNDLIGAANFNSNRMIFLDTPIILQWIRATVTTSTGVTSTVRIKASFSR